MLTHFALHNTCHVLPSLALFCSLYCTVISINGLWLQKHYGLTLCSLFYGTAVLYTGQEERLKQRYVHSRYSEILVNDHNMQPLFVCLEANGRMRCHAVWACSALQHIKAMFLSPGVFEMNQIPCAMKTPHQFHNRIRTLRNVLNPRENCNKSGSTPNVCRQ